MNNAFPDYPNFYCSFTSPSQIEIKHFFEQNGWKIRKQGFDEFECSNEWAELNLVTSQSYTLLNGIIANPIENFKVLIEFFKAIDARFQAELYDEHQNIILETNL